MKKLFCLVFVLFFLASVLAADLTIEEKDSQNVIIGGLEMPAVFNLEITNHGNLEDFNIYNLLGFSISPTKINIPKGQTKDVQLEVYPYGEFKFRGFYNFKYYVQDSNSDVESFLWLEVIDLKDAFEVGASEIEPDSGVLNFYIHNKKNFYFENIDAEFSSSFFNVDETFSLEPYEKKIFSVDLDKEDIKKLGAGFYTINSDVTYEGETANVEGILKFAEKDVLTSTDKNFGFIINTITIKKENEGNVLAKTEISVDKNLISRLFTSFNVQPDVVEREGYVIHYIWDREIKPGEVLEVVVKTNWTIPFIICLLIILVIVYAKRSAKGDIVLKKKVQFVQAKGGEFALKVSILVQANTYVEKVNIIDKLPTLVKIYEKFGFYSPTRVDEKNRKIEWNFDKLEAREIRTISYVVYSKVGVLGKFALPSATAIYEKGGKIKETESNRAFFVAEQRKGNEEDE